MTDDPSPYHKWHIGIPRPSVNPISKKSRLAMKLGASERQREKPEIKLKEPPPWEKD